MQKDVLQRLVRIDYLIRIKATGSPHALADKLGISERSVYEYLSIMKDMGAPIKFDPYRETYYYDGEGLFATNWTSKFKESGKDIIVEDGEIADLEMQLVERDDIPAAYDRSDTLPLLFNTSEFSPQEISEIIASLSDIYQEISGDPLIIRNASVYNHIHNEEPVVA